MAGDLSCHSRFIAMRVEKVYQPLSAGILEIWPVPGGDPVLFYPGTMLAPGHYETFLLALREAGFTAGAMHFAGHGLAKKEKMDSFRSMLAEGLEAEDFLRREYGRVAVCGHSQGGILALARAGQTPSVPAVFSICATFPQNEEAIDLTLFAPLRKHRAALLSFIVASAKRAPRLPIPPPFYLPVRKLLAGKLPPVHMGFDEGRISYPLKFLASLFSTVISPELNCPFYLFSAVNDGLFTRKITEAAFAAIKAPRKELIWTPDGGHLAPLNPRLAAFIARKMASVCAGLGFSLNLAVTG